MLRRFVPRSFPRHLGKNAVIVLALFAAGFFAAWLRLRPYLGDAGKYSDGERVFGRTTDEGIRYAVWDDPEWVAGLSGEEGDATRPTVSPDGRLLVFASGELGLNADLYVAELRDGVPEDPRPLAALNGSADEWSPAFGHGALYFASNRRGGVGGLDLWRAPYEDGRFGEPEWLGADVNTRADETDPAPSPDGRTVAFASDRGAVFEKDFDVWVAQPRATVDGFWEVWRFDTLNTDADEREPGFSGDGRTVFFASNRALDVADRIGRRDWDLYRSVFDRGRWLAPEPLVGLNGPGDERAPFVEQSGFGLWFARSEAPGDADGGAPLGLARAQSLELVRLPARPVGLAEVLILIALLVLALLAWLAKYWEALDVLYKCFLASLLVHLALLWWFRDLYPESQRVQMAAASEGATFQVQLAPSRSELASRSERGGDLETERSEPAEGAGPARVETTQAAELADASTEVAAGELDLRVERPELGGPARDTAALDAAARAAAERPVAPDVRTPAESFARRADGAPDLRVADDGRAAERPESAPQAERAATGAALAARDVRPEAREALRGERAELAPARRDAELDGARAASSQALAGSTRTAVELPREALERRGGAAPALELASASSFERDGASTRAGPSRSTPGLPAQERASAAAPAARPLELAAPTRSDAGASANAPTADLQPAAPASAAVALRDADATESRDASSSTPVPELDLTDLAPAPVTLARRADGPRRLGAASAGSASVERATPRPGRLRVDTAARAEPARGELGPPAAAWGQTPYQSRAGPEKALALREYGGTAETERAVAAGLAYLARIQAGNGSWGSRGDFHDKYGEVRIGKTGLALLAFLGAGHTPGSEADHADSAERAVQFLLARQHQDSGHFGDGSAYSHGIATYALAECFAMTEDERLRGPLQRAVAHILEKQVNTRDARSGGWSYYYAGDRVFDRWPRVSVSAWQVMALESAQLGGLDVPRRAFERARRFLLDSWDERGGWFRYSHDPERLGSNYPTLPASTPAALFCLSLLGEAVDTADLRDAWDFVLRRAPETYRPPSDDDFVFRARGNLYFWYYGTLACFRVGGRAWEGWNERMKSALLPAQNEDGSWDAISLYARSYAGDDDRDLSYTTAMCVLTLEIYYRYFTPLLEVR